MQLTILLILIITGVIYFLMITNFCIKFFKFKYIGNIYIYFVIPYLVCLTYALYANYNPVVVPENAPNGFVVFATSLFDALKMIAVAFDRTAINLFFDPNIPLNYAFGLGYVASSVLALLFASITTVTIFLRSFTVKASNVFREFFIAKTRINYIFTDSKNRRAVRLAEELNRSKDNTVKIIVTRSSLKTQDGTEFRDELVGRGLEVITENHTYNYFTCLVRKFIDKKFSKLYFWYPYKKRQIRFFSVFNNDEDSTNLANNFKRAILNNRVFKKYIINREDKLTEKDLAKLECGKVFISYQNVDIDINNEYSKATYHIINTLSQYDMVSAEFIMDNSLNYFIDFNKINDEVDNQHFNVTFIGLGKINRPIFEKMISAYQLWGDNINKINYHILDQNSNDLVKAFTNEYTSLPAEEKENNPPLLYRVDGDCDGKDLREYEVLESYFKKIYADIDKNNRFKADGFEMFVISICDTNTDIKIAFHLRNILSKRFSDEQLKRTYIFVRIGSKTISDNFTSTNNFAYTQSEFYKVKKENKLQPLPVIVFGENALMSKFVDNDYRKIDIIGQASDIAYEDGKGKGVDKLKIKKQWMKKNKIKVIENISTAYSLKSKLELVGYSLDENYIIEKLPFSGHHEYISSDILEDIEKKIELAKASKFENLEPNIKRLAELEHNRWMASSYINHHYGQYDIDSYLNTIEKKDGKIEDSTKNPEQSKHVCMLTNKDLRKLGDRITAIDNGDKLYYNFANKLVFANDLNGLKHIAIELDLDGAKRKKKLSK